ncbi:MAG TPA: bifunctional UDP-N-acetylglucosamine diphosphorylase/glucosamine-1-phosphate N-acetyltransferase GlmU [Solirubrobacteraceae bacterium]
MSFTAVVMAAGQGTRMKSQTPKVLHDLCGRPMVQWPILAAREAGADRVIVVTGPDGTAPDGCEHAIQPVANGTGGAVVAAAELLGPDGAVVVINGDAALITADALRALVDGHEAHATVATVTLDDPAGYGRVIRDGDGRVVKIVETKSPGDATEAELAVNEVNGGVYVFDAAPLRAALAQLDTDNAQGELYLPDVVAKVDSADAVDLRDPELLAGVNDRAELAHVAAVLQRRILDAHMRNGVTVVNPAATTVDATVTLAGDVTLEPGTVLRGATTVGAGSTIGPSSTLIDTVVGARSRLLHTYAIEARIDDGVSVGPFAYLRPGTHLRDAAKVGTFVEIKNSDIGEGTKVPHLSYIGDADVGPGTNLGASTVTANYDGVSKHRTTIGARVKSSVDVTFVAPVRIGDDAWTAAGSVITDDVPDGALGVARSRQKNIPGYAARRAARSESES